MTKVTNCLKTRNAKTFRAKKAKTNLAKEIKFLQEQVDSLEYDIWGKQSDLPDDAPTIYEWCHRSIRSEVKQQKLYESKGGFFNYMFSLSKEGIESEQKKLESELRESELN